MPKRPYDWRVQCCYQETRCLDCLTPTSSRSHEFSTTATSLGGVGRGGGNITMSAFSTVGDVFTDPEFAARGNSVPWTTRVANAQGFSLCPSARMNSVLMLMAVTNSTTPSVNLGPATPLPTFPSSFTCAPPTSLSPDSVMRSVHAQQQRMDRATSKHQRRRNRKRLAQPSPP